jgi:hypothetical protein
MRDVLRNPAAFIYGMIVLGTLLAAESAKRETFPRTVAAVVIATLLYWLVHGYAQLTAQQLRERRPIELSHLGEALRDELGVVLGAAPPLFALLFSWLAGASLNAAVAAAIWTDVGMIVLIELAAGIRADQRGRKLLEQALLGGSLGVLVIVLRLLLH